MPRWPEQTASERFWGKVDKSSDCWIWLASVDRDGYGKFKAAGRMYKAHRFAYEDVVGPIPADRELDHLCRVRNCVNPAHLEPVTHQVNQGRGRYSPTASHCVHGHPRTPENVYIWNGRRECRICRRAASQRAASRRASREAS